MQPYLNSGSSLSRKTRPPTLVFIGELGFFISNLNEVVQSARDGLKKKTNAIVRVGTVNTTFSILSL